MEIICTIQENNTLLTDRQSRTYIFVKDNQGKVYLIHVWGGFTHIVTTDNGEQRDYTLTDIEEVIDSVLQGTLPLASRGRLANVEIYEYTNTPQTGLYLDLRYETTSIIIDSVYCFDSLNNYFEEMSDENEEDYED